MCSNMLTILGAMVNIIVWVGGGFVLYDQFMGMRISTLKMIKILT